MNTWKSWLMLLAVFADVSMKNIPFFSAYSIASFKMNEMSSPCTAKYILVKAKKIHRLPTRNHCLPGMIQLFFHANQPYYPPRPWRCQDLHAFEVPVRHIWTDQSDHIILILYIEVRDGKGYPVQEARKSYEDQI